MGGALQASVAVGSLLKRIKHQYGKAAQQEGNTEAENDALKEFLIGSFTSQVAKQYLKQLQSQRATVEWLSKLEGGDLAATGQATNIPMRDLMVIRDAAKAAVDGTAVEEEEEEEAADDAIATDAEPAATVGV